MGSYETELNLKDTELRLGLPGCDELEKRSCKRSSMELEDSKCKSNVTTSNNVSSDSSTTNEHDSDSVQPAK